MESPIEEVNGRDPHFKTTGGWATAQSSRINGIQIRLPQGREISNQYVASGVKPSRGAMVKTCAGVLMGVLLCLHAMASDQKPNFSGVWIWSEPGSTAVSTIEHHDPEMKVTFDSSSTMGSSGSLLGRAGTEG